MRRQNLLYYKNATLLKNAMSFFVQSSDTVRVWKQEGQKLPNAALKTFTLANEMQGGGGLAGPPQK